jgi:hypothetical protein
MSDIKLDDIPEWSDEEQRKADEARKKQRELEKLLMEDYINKFTPREQAIIDIVIERMTRNLSDVEEYIADIRYYLDEMYGAVSNAEDSANYANSNSDDIMTHVDEELEARELKKRLKDLENETKDPSHE